MIDRMTIIGNNAEFVLNFLLKDFMAIAVIDGGNKLSLVSKKDIISIPTDRIAHFRMTDNINNEEDFTSDFLKSNINGNPLPSYIKITDKKEVFK